MNNYDYSGNGFMDMFPNNDMMPLPNNNPFMNMNLDSENNMMPNQDNTFMNTNIDCDNNTSIQDDEADRQQQNLMLSTPQEGFMRGNLFSNLFQGYKNYRPATLSPTNEQERLFLSYAQLAFAAHELNLYLDNYPDDRSIIRLFNDYRTMANEALKAYESQFGPITLSSEMLNQFPWMWEQLNFPWDEGGM